MCPTLALGAWRVSSYAVWYAVAILVGGSLCYLRLVRGRIPERRAAGVVLGTIWAGLIGSYLVVGIVAALGSWVAEGKLRVEIQGGTYSGALLVGLATLTISARRAGLPLPWVSDRIMPIIPLGQAIGRMGCLARGCCYGQLADAPLGVMLPDVAGTWLNRYPTQLLAAAADATLFATLLWIDMARSRRSTARAGLLLPLYLLLYGTKRFGLEFLRADGQPLGAAGGFSNGAAGGFPNGAADGFPTGAADGFPTGALTVGHWMALAFALLGLWLLLRWLRAGRSPAHNRVTARVA